MRFIYLFGTIALMALGQMLFKLLASSHRDIPWVFVSPPFLGTVALYGVATLMWFMALRSFPLTIAYPAQSLAIVVVVLVGTLVFHEPITPVQVAGIVTIVGGLLMVGLGHL